MKQETLTFVILFLVLLVVFIGVLAFRSFSELGSILEEGKDLVSDENTPDDTPEDTTDNTPEDTDTPTTPDTPDTPTTPEDTTDSEDPFVAKDTSNAALYNIFVSSTVGSKDGVIADDLGLSGPSLNGFLHDGLTVYENGAMTFNDTTPGYFYEVGDVGGAEKGLPYRLYYRVFRDGAWESNVHVVDGTNFVLYLSVSYDGTTYNAYQRYDGNFSVPDGCAKCVVAIGLADGFTPDFEGFRLYALME